MERAEVKRRAGPVRQIRGPIEIMGSILDEAETEKAKTHIMYKCNLSYRQLQAYVKLLLRMEMLISISKSEGKNMNFFKTSAKGLEFLGAYRKLKALMS